MQFELDTKMLSFIICLVIVLHSNDALPTSETGSMPTCKTKNNDVNECLKTYLQEAIKHSSQGNAKFAIPPLDPYFIPKLTMSPNKNTGGVIIEMKNATTHGFSKAIVKKVHADLQKGFFEGHYIVPVSTLLGNYNLTGKVFSIPINGNGKSNVTMVDVQHSIKILGDVIVNNADGKKYLNVNSVVMHAKPKKMKVKFEQLFKDNKELGDMLNNMMNDNWEDVYARLQPKLEEEMSKHMFVLIKRFFDDVPYSDLFPDV